MLRLISATFFFLMTVPFSPVVADEFGTKAEAVAMVESVQELFKSKGAEVTFETPKRRVKAKLREVRVDARQINETWAMNFVHDQLATGRKIRVLTIIDTFSRFSPAVDPRFSYRGEDVVQTLERVQRIVGYPKAMVDQGAGFISRDLDLWAYQRCVILDF